MLHKLAIKRIYNLGNYQNITLEVETSDIPDEIWNDGDRLATIRNDLQQEILASLAQHLLMRDQNQNALKTGDYEGILRENA